MWSSILLCVCSYYDLIICLISTGWPQRDVLRFIEVVIKWLLLLPETFILSRVRAAERWQVVRFRAGARTPANICVPWRDDAPFFFLHYFNFLCHRLTRRYLRCSPRCSCGVLCRKVALVCLRNFFFFCLSCSSYRCSRKCLLWPFSLISCCHLSPQVMMLLFFPGGEKKSVNKTHPEQKTDTNTGGFFSFSFFFFGAHDVSHVATFCVNTTFKKKKDTYLIRVLQQGGSRPLGGGLRY